MIKAAFFDIDGTLLSHKTRKVCQSTRDALEKLRSAGILCVVATGRHILQMDKLPLQGLEFDGYITLNGQLVLDRDRNLVFDVPMRGAAREEAIRLFQEKKLPMLMMEKDRTYLNTLNPLAAYVHEKITSPLPAVEFFHGAEIYQISPYFEGEEEPLLAEIAKHCIVTRWGFGGVDIIAKGGGKVAGIQGFLEKTGITREEIIAFGDGENDMDMLQYAGIGVAMGNAVEKVKAVADYITADIDDDGIEKALKHFELI